MRPSRHTRALAVALTAIFALPLRAELATRRFGPLARGSAARDTRLRPPEGYVVRAATAPLIDGKLDDEAWTHGQLFKLERTLDGEGRASQATEVRALRDDNNLYLAFRCLEPAKDRVRTQRREHDGEIWSDDSVEVFIGLGKSGTYYHFGVNASGSTYDAQERDRAWESGFRAAVGESEGAWTAVMALPLARLVRGAPAPSPSDAGAKGDRWIANFHRNRYATGRLEEFAWSPTFSGESHAPDRFGTLLFENPPAEPAAGETRGAPVKVLPVREGVALVQFELSTLPKNARICRADLHVTRSELVDGRYAEALVDLEVFPCSTEAKEGETPKPEGEPLAVRGPWFDCFDATAAVRAWTAGKPNAGFWIKTCPFCLPAAAYLDVAYEGQAENPPPQVKGVRAFHRAGQTFITWHEIEEPVGKDEITWAGLKQVLGNMDRSREVRYVVYRHNRAITAENLREAELLAVVAPLSCWNTNGRNIERPIDLAIATKDVLFCGQWNPFGSATLDGEYGRDCPIERLVIEDGQAPLARGTGLYVHTAASKGPVCYAVVTMLDGVQNTAGISEGNTTGPVDENPAAAQPVLQRELPRMPFFNYAGKRLHYVQWAGPPCYNLPSQYYNWSVCLPAGEKEGENTGAPLELSLHRDGNSYWRTQFRMERDSVVLSPHDFPVRTWWYGYHEALGTLRSFKSGCIQPYTERRLLSFVEWAATKWSLDRNRVIVSGSRGGASGSGALHLGLRHPEVFSLVISGHGLPAFADVARGGEKYAGLAQTMQVVWGRAEWGLRTDAGRSVWDEHDMTKLVASLPQTVELPLVTLTSGNEPMVQQFHRACLECRRALIAEFEWGGARYVPVTSSETFPNAVFADVRRDRSLLAFCSTEALKTTAAGGMGHFNRDVSWREISDEKTRYEATICAPRGGTADVALRRLQRFKAEAGKTYHWSATSSDPKVGPQAGDLTVGGDGLLVLRSVKLARELRLNVTPK